MLRFIRIAIALSELCPGSTQLLKTGDTSFFDGVVLFVAKVEVAKVVKFGNKHLNQKVKS